MIIKKNIDKESIKLLNNLSNKSINELRILIKYYNNLYFNKNITEISDTAFDKLYSVFKFLSKKSNISFNCDNNFSYINEKIPNVVRVVHDEPMLSLDKCYNNGDYYKWRKNIKNEVIVMPKIDGVACTLHYNNHSLILAATRGNGEIGENVLNNVEKIVDIPLYLSFCGNIEIRGEIYCKKSLFNKVFNNNYSSSRNLVAATLRQKKVNILGYNKLSFFAYDIRKIKFISEIKKFNLLKKLGFPIFDIKISNSCNNINKIFNYYFVMRKKYNYETDGIVFKANNCKEQHYLGETSHHPRFALAYKYQGISAQTKLIKVIWSISRIGVITPICLVVPVFILGANINKISIFNIQKFQKLKLKKETLFEISRKGGIIPYIDRVLYSYGDSLNIVEKCPSCKEQTVIKGNFLFCSIADKCISVLEARILFFCRAIRLYGFGKQLIRKLIVNKFIKKPIDIYRLNKIKLLSLNGINTVLANKLLQSVKRRRTLFLSTFLFALDFKKVGKTVTKIVVNHFGSLSKIRNANRDTLTKLNGIGAIIADAYVVGLKKHSKDIDELLLFVSLIKDKKTN